LVALLAPTPAAAEFGAPVKLSAAGQDGDAPQVAVDTDGDALVVWQGDDGVHDQVKARARSAAGALGPILTIGFGTSPRVALDADGDAVIAWMGHDGANFRIQARARTKAGVLRATQTISAAGHGGFFPELAVDRDGDAVIVWAQNDGAGGQVHARRRSAAGALGAIQPISSASSDAVAPQVALDQDGDALIVWQGSSGSGFRTQARARSAAGALGPVQNLSGLFTFASRLAVDLDGDALIVWQGPSGIQARARSAAGALGAIQTLSLAGRPAQDPRVARDSDGDALIVWQGFDGTTHRIEARTRSAAGTLGAIRFLSAAGDHAGRPLVALEPNGDGVVVWNRIMGGTPKIQARTRSATGVLGPFQPIVVGGSAALPEMAMDAAGDALVVWQRSDGTNLRVEASAGP
jgi:hypothetical protein